AKRIPSSMSAMTTPEGISTDIPRASSRDQKSALGSPRYKHVTSPSLRSKRGGITLRRKSCSTRTSLSEITKKSLRERGIILSSVQTFALGHTGGPEDTMRHLTPG